MLTLKERKGESFRHTLIPFAASVFKLVWHPPLLKHHLYVNISCSQTFWLLVCVCLLRCALSFIVKLFHSFACCASSSTPHFILHTIHSSREIAATVVCSILYANTAPPYHGLATYIGSTRMYGLAKVTLSPASSPTLSFFPSSSRSSSWRRWLYRGSGMAGVQKLCKTIFKFLILIVKLFTEISLYVVLYLSHS